MSEENVELVRRFCERDDQTSLDSLMMSLMEGHWVTPFKIVGFFQAQDVGYDPPPDPEGAGTHPENYACTDVSTPFVGISTASAR